MRQRNIGSGGVVYSSENGRMCPACNTTVASCICGKKTSSPLSSGSNAIVRVSRATSGRRGKGVTIITGVPLQGPEMDNLARELKKKCGAGGTLKDGIIEIQGEHRDFLVEELRSRGWVVKRSGG
ncbi:MAG: stress response translation initiation inhibitor YciH [Candidatus Wallbacteria bacterium HGW-Wallbacteria-1]|jgi:translation initiation factor 1|uniref:Stress response translation initiation inhibitor YciH n=1 Tax=Candidatus Wallbacteria bacterium HGW-Wallbacteria-1 TaxID=2013854 RepID=A0A2N1PRP1_9BACT|nr:MAG: stress response translation initiation inhibitor YciH [Candidatus Wallbacteria bacterium HGW-Wallbacteria-1]